MPDVMTDRPGKEAATEEFRPARPEELREVAQLEAHSFPALGRSIEEREATLAEGPRGGVETLWVGVDGGRLVATCQLLRLQQWVGGVALPVAGVGSVAIAPTHRRRGLAGRLLTTGLRHARERGDVGSALYPFRINFYERYGYGLAGEAHQYQIPPEIIPDAPERARVCLVESEQDRADVRAVYDAWSRRETGQLVRPERAWAWAWQGPNRAAVVYRAPDGTPQGYAIVHYRVDLPITERFLEVEERAWLTHEARRGLYAWLGSLGDQWQQVLYRAHPDEHFVDRLEEPRLPMGSAPGWGLWFPAATVLRGPMFRLLDVAAAWEARPVRREDPLAIGLEIVDEQIPENAGTWRLVLEGGRARMERNGSGAVDATLAMRVRVLSRIFMCALRPSAAVAAGLATVDRPEVLPMLDVAFGLRRPWTFERF